MSGTCATRQQSQRNFGTSAEHFVRCIGLLKHPEVS
jgi:hypothetical protein